ncbi:hypothetical protein LTR10_013154 [Elasticomyces elasticus]|uniref:Rhodopsin domain-containing protein n=1 Tax=Exophiala sideris TaxID=1016849 RepID=A0ABR0JBJ6_9EURO|nr:hypothetical protein LTR10_013154 [Elasticomyces elasticus]KAK5030529.1 hypothetical protein LTS07_005313 [Exophiala sideris]KAK5038583.1 hypothetical protein LTR13_004330 [Exophiala sideris]KAK5060464.1 hypothetical protein LTR69_005781 [Exophiala sideris]KAK5183376.1 hypothetical protein LTR44_004377 [Eurotiomycetes sp. CCFEE 6388]
MSITNPNQFHGEFLPHNSLTGEIYRLNIAFIAVTSTFIGVRLIVRGFVVKHVAADDYLIVAAGLFATAFSAMAIVGVRYGLGKHVWDIPQNAEYVEKIKKTIQTLWICQVMYVTALMLVKLSIVVSYLRVFPTTIFRRTMYTLSAAIVGVWLCSILITIFQCKPVQGAWDFTLPRNCLKIVDFYYFTTAFSIFTDFLLCTLPLPVFWRLNVPKRQKYVVSMLFGIGLFATVASALRISVLQGVESLDVTQGSVATMKWSVVEVGTGIICACIPCLKPLFKNWLPDKISTNRSGAREKARPTHTPRIGTPYSEAHELTKPTDGWKSYNPPEARIKGEPVVTMQNFV